MNFMSQMNQDLRPFSLLIKPAGADCNLRCKYCFYLDHLNFYGGQVKHPRMTEEVLERLVSSYMATPQPQYSFGWQGGEPTLMGEDFFRKAVQFQKKYGQAGASVGNGLQTNCTLITDEMADLFAEYNFLLGVSLDGPAEIHDKYRLTAGDRGSHELVMKGIDKIRERNVEFNILTLVSESNQNHGGSVYDYLVDNGFLYHQYIPGVELDEKREPLPFSVSGEKWGEFLCEVFDRWYPNDIRKVSVRLFDSILDLLVNNRRNVCHIGTNCCQYFVVEYNGDVYPCDFFVEKHLLLGNIQQHSWRALQQSPRYLDFGKQKLECNPQCHSCKFMQICSADCLKHRAANNGGDPRTLSKLCEGWKMFYEHTLGRFMELADMLRKERAGMQQPAAGPAPNLQQTPTVGRNDPCPCGSGKKFKRCCGRKKY